MLELMLLKGVKGLGEAGDMVRVRAGYARNFLLPRRLAAPASKDALQQAEAHKKRMAEHTAKQRDEALAHAERLNSMSVHVEARAQESGGLYGSVTSAIIAETITKEGVATAEGDVLLEEPIKDLGIYEVEVRVFEDVTAKLKVYVVQPPPAAE